MRQGGEAGKFGNAYEASWTVANLLLVADGTATELCPEPMDDALGIEFTITQATGVREHHSAKIQTIANYWTMGALLENPPARSKIGDLFNKLAKFPSDEAYFVSEVGANPLQLICEAARLAGNDVDFKKRLNGSEDADFQTSIMPHFKDVAEARDRLRRLHAIAAYQAILYATQTHYGLLREILLRMLVSQDGDARETAAEAIALASFRVNAAAEDIQFVRKAPEDARAAWAEVAENNLRFAEVSQRCREWLNELFFDPSRKVRDVASRCFHKLSSDQLCAEVELIDTFLKSPAFEHAASFLLMALDGAVDRLPDVVCRIPERALELFRAQKNEVQRPWWTHQMSTLVLRLYNQTRDPEIRRRCLDGIDSMIELGVGDVGVELEKIERE